MAASRVRPDHERGNVPYLFSVRNMFFSAIEIQIQNLKPDQ